MRGRKSTLYACMLMVFIITSYAVHPLFATRNSAHKRSVLALTFHKGELQTSATTHFADTAFHPFVRKVLLWKRIKHEQSLFGFGIAGDVLVAGSLHARGFLRVLEDASKRYAWSFVFDEHARWFLLPTSASLPLGLAVSYKIPRFTVNAWMRLSDLKAQHAIHSTGLMSTIGAGRGNFYKARFLYNYSMRKFLHLSKSVARSWYVNVPTTLELHGLAMRHEITTALVDAQLTAKMSLPDTLPMGGGGSGLLRFKLSPFALSLFAQGLSAGYVTSAMKYQRTLWTHSGESTVSYGRISFVRLRYALEYRNPMAYPTAIRKGIDRTIYQRYYFAWKQEIAGRNSDHALLFDYGVVSLYARHKAAMQYSMDYQSLNMRLGLTTWYTHTKHGYDMWDSPLKHINLDVHASLTQKDLLPQLDGFVRLKATMRVYDTKTGKHTREQGILREVFISLGALLRIEPVVLRVSFPYVYKMSGDFSGSVTFSLRYTID